MKIPWVCHEVGGPPTLVSFVGSALICHFDEVSNVSLMQIENVIACSDDVMALAVLQFFAHRPSTHVRQLSSSLMTALLTWGCDRSSTPCSPACSVLQPSTSFFTPSG
eukprot:44454-Eustigmatos_ZCMA.PRE.1